MMSTAELLKHKINWINHSSNIRYWYFEEQGKIILLRMNDFPDEPLYTVINGLEITDIDDLPKNWHVPYD